MTPRREGATARSPSGEPLGTLAVALDHTHRLLQRDARLAEQQCREILKVLPDTAEAHRLLGSALAAQRRHGEAIASLVASLFLLVFIVSTGAVGLPASAIVMGMVVRRVLREGQGTGAEVRAAKEEIRGWPAQGRPR